MVLRPGIENDEDLRIEVERVAALLAVDESMLASGIELPIQGVRLA